MENKLPQATTYLVKDTGKIKVHTLVTPDAMFANATHIIELPTQLILVDGHYFAQYGREFRALADSLKKPITRFYVSHDHPDHYLGMGDAFADVEVYALKEIKDEIVNTAQHHLTEKQARFGDLIATKVKLPTHEVTPGTEVIDGVTFIFEEVKNAESPFALTIKLPELGIWITQDIVYNHTHLFVSGPTDGWKATLQKVKATDGYDIILAGHGEPTDKKSADRAIQYLDKVNEILKDAKNSEEYKKRILASYPEYAAAGLIDLYLPFLFPS